MLFMAGRIKFRLPGGGSAGPAGAPSVLIAYGQSNVLALHQSKVPGYIVELQNRKAATAIDLFSTEAA